MSRVGSENQRAGKHAKRQMKLKRNPISKPEPQISRSCENNCMLSRRERPILFHRESATAAVLM
jgi:hypothetical protein